MSNSLSLKILVRASLVIAAVLVVSMAWTGSAAADTLSAIEDLTSTEPKAKEIPEIKQAFERFTARDVNGAKKILDEAVKAHDELPPSEVIMAQFFLAVRQPNGVRPWLQRAVTEHPTDPEALVMLGQIDAQAGLLIESWLLLERANSLMAKAELPESRKKALQTAINSQLSQLAMARKSWEEAKGYLNRLLEAQPSNAVALQLLGQVFFEEGKAPEALQKLQAAEKAAKDAGNKMLAPKAILAQWYENKDDRTNAVKMMTEAITESPKDLDVRLAAAQWAFRTKNFDEAKKQADVALSLDPASLNALLMAGNVALFQKDYPTAEKHLRTAWAKEPSSFAVSNNLALALCEQDDKDKLKLAEELAKMNIPRNQEEPEAYSTLGRVLYKGGHPAEAKELLRKAASLGKAVSPDTAYYMAVILADDPNTKEDAKKLLQSALKAQGLFAQRTEAEALLQRLSK